MILPDQADQKAQHASRELVAHITRTIAQSDGWISFAQFMDMLLYTPKWGYYTGDRSIFGEAGDFITAPEMTPLFAATLTRAMHPLFLQTQACILEAGAGTGRLAYDLLSQDTAIRQYDILEISNTLRARQQRCLKDFSQTRWIKTLPESFSGVLLANEVLDAIPVQLIVKRGSGWHELGVSVTSQGFHFVERACDAGLLAHIARQIPEPERLAEAYVTEIHTGAATWMRAISHMLARGGCGAAILIDYGMSAYEYYAAERRQGTLLCHSRHRGHEDVFYKPGQQDMTAHVDFTLMAREALNAGLELWCYTTLAAFLMAAGIDEVWMEALAQGQDTNTQAVQTLLSPGGMGEQFKVLMVGVGMMPPDFCKSCDKSNRL